MMKQHDWDDAGICRDCAVAMNLITDGSECVPPGVVPAPAVPPCPAPEEPALYIMRAALEEIAKPNERTDRWPERRAHAALVEAYPGRYTFTPRKHA